MGSVHGGNVVAVDTEFTLKSSDVVNRMVDANAHGNGGDGNGHHIQWYASPAHAAENNARG